MTIVQILYLLLFLTILNISHSIEQNGPSSGDEKIFATTKTSEMIYLNEDKTFTNYISEFELFSYKFSTVTETSNLTETNETDLCYNSFFNIYNDSSCDFPPPPPPLNFSHQ
jgi:hypothetical protein